MSHPSGSIKSACNTLILNQQVKKCLFVSGYPHFKKMHRIELFVAFPFLLMWGFVLLWYGKLQAWKWSKNPTPKYNLAIVVIAKNESEYISEWLAFHKAQGVDIVFLYNNDSTDNLCDVLAPYIADGFVVYNEIHGELQQKRAYNDALKRYGYLAKYMAFIDCDEFLMPVDNDKKLLDVIDSYFAKSLNIGGVAVNWIVYGSSGHEVKTEGLVLERFIYRTRIEFDFNKWVKCIVRPQCVRFQRVHSSIFYKGFYCVNNEGKLLPSETNTYSSFKGLRINHYSTKSKEEFIKRSKLRRADSGRVKQIDEFYLCDRDNVKDEFALQSVEKVKEIMRRYRDNNE